VPVRCWVVRRFTLCSLMAVCWVVSWLQFIASGICHTNRIPCQSLVFNSDNYILCFFICHMLVWEGIVVAGFFSWLFTDISATVAPIGMILCMMVHIGSGWIFSFCGAIPPVIPKSEILGLNLGHLTVNISEMVSFSITCQLELNISLTRAF